jgi:hypothetical protein
MDQLGQLFNAPPEVTRLDLPSLVLNLTLGAVLGFLLRIHYVQFGKSVSNRLLFASNFVPLILAVVLIISIVKASLALSLGLVGALSIVRFRTPIKEPEELVYLFLAIGVGLGLGANQALATTVAFGMIFTLLALRAWRRQTDERQALYLEVELDDGSQPQTALEHLLGVLRPTLGAVSLRRFDAADANLLASFSVACVRGEQVGEAAAAIRSAWPGARVTFLNQDGIPGV